MKPLILALLATPVLAQADFTFARALNDYIYTFDQYRSAHQQYELKKNEYLKFKTLTSQTDAYIAGLSLLKHRDDAIRTHLTALRLKLAETPGVDPTDRQSKYARIDQEVNWLYAHQTKLNNTNNLTELTRVSQELENRYPNINVLMYQSLIAILKSKQIYLHTQITADYQTLKTKIGDIKASGEDTDIIDRWLVQAQQRLELSQERQAAATNLAAKFTPQARNLPQDFLNAQFTLKESHQYLKETISALQEIIREIKT